MKEIQVHIGRRNQSVEASLDGFLLGDGGGGVDLTAENIKTALGYTPADQEDVDKLSEEKVDQANTLWAILQKTAFTEQLTDAELTAFKTAWGIETLVIPATGITLDKTTLSFTDSTSQTLVATVEPSDTTDKIVWSSNAESVATVTNGVVKPISNGSATVTAKAGSVSVTCAVTVDIEEEEQVTLTSISAVYTGGDVAEGTALTDLTGITVTGTYSDGSTSEITGYTLSGEIAEGENTITVSYGGLTTIFTVTGVAEETEPAVVYNVFAGEYENSAYAGTLFEQYGANYNLYTEKIDVSNASKLYYRIAKTNKTKTASIVPGYIGIYDEADNFIDKIDLSINSNVTTEDYNYDVNGLETIGETVIYCKAIGSVSLESFEDKSYALFSVRPSVNMLTTWEGNAQSTSPLTLEGWV